ncbi:ABC transporter ATP-binding protein [Chitinivibrio alkaliphilus]|uniref:ABC transporter ATP-binding protein n=1 Tax=Chitinivibrio alkaliphilus ACht1 TaxID=1313304 RepID=U7DB81_9BACT|nr:ABC transporter ATP-binding protein [Chitinivibrio alkaliphilus]ERP31680.1 ABC transporter ATP-binding protein [Chitinivibrio alkaliphilus ACht1]
MISIKNIDKSFGKTKQVLKNLSLHVETGEVCGLVGLNGAGKTTLIRLLTGILRPDHGEISLMGYRPGVPEVYRSVSVLLEHDGFNGNLSFAENLLFFARCRRMCRAETDLYAKEFWSDLWSRPEGVKQYSRGERSLCGLARTFLGNPSIIILDEPTVALDQQGQRRFHELVKKHRTQGATMVVSSHNQQDIRPHCSAIAHLTDGQVTKKRVETADTLYLSCSDPRGAQDILHRAGVSSFRRETGVVFSHEPPKKVADLVVALVEAGVAIYELRREDSFAELSHDL